MTLRDRRLEPAVRRQPGIRRRSPSPKRRQTACRVYPRGARPRAGWDTVRQRFLTSCAETRREKCTGPNSVGWSNPAAPTSSASASMVARWKLYTRSDLSGTTSARWRLRSCVDTPVGQRSVWHDCDWMQPSANMKPRAELHQSAPNAMARAISKALAILPLAPILMRSRVLIPMRALCTKLRPSRNGIPT